MNILDCEVKLENKSLSPRQLFLHIGRKHYPIESLAMASRKFRELIESQNWGCSQCPQSLLRNYITDQDNNFVGQIAYNGKIFLTFSMPAIYDPFELKQGTN